MKPENTLNKQYKTLRLFYLFYLILAILALILFFIDKRATLVLLGFSLVYYFVAVRRCSKTYERNYIHVCIQNTLEKYLHNAVCLNMPNLEPKNLQITRLIASNQSKGGILCREGGYGSYKDRTVYIGDVTFAHSFLMDGKTHHEFVTGAWVTVELKQDTGLDWRLLSTRAMMKPSRHAMLKREKDLQSPQNVNCKWYTPDDWLILRPEGTPDMPGEAVLKVLGTLKDNKAYPLAVCIQHDKLHVFVINRLLGQKVNVREAPREEWLAVDRLPELGWILKLSDACCADMRS